MDTLQQMETSPDKCNLLVEKSRREDSGPFTITAENAYGKDSGTIEVNKCFCYEIRYVFMVIFIYKHMLI